MEALNIMRTEKGFVTHSEIDGRTLPADLIPGKWRAQKNYVGRFMLEREGLKDLDRQV